MYRHDAVLVALHPLHGIGLTAHEPRYVDLPFQRRASGALEHALQGGARLLGRTRNSQLWLR